MKNILLTTALVSLIAAVPLHAQTASGTDTGTGTTDDTLVTGTTETTTGATVTPPEGYTQFETTALTSDELEGATIYDANGESVGEISDFVFESSGSASGDMGSGSTTVTGTDSMTDTTGTDTADTMTDTTTTGTDGAVTDSDTATDTANTETTTDPATGTDTATTTDTTAGDTTVADNSVSNEAGTGVDAGQEIATQGQISHVVLDVGGFLGIGAHTVAVPLDALQVFRDGNNDLRVYLPWTQAQLEALPEFDENDPATFAAGDDLLDSGAATGSTTDTGTSTGTDTGTGTGTETDTDVDTGTGTTTTP